MATQILATGNTVVNSTEVTVAAGDQIVVSLKEFSSDVSVTISLKDDVGNFTIVGMLDPSGPAKILAAPGVYRMRRVSGTCGIFTG